MTDMSKEAISTSRALKLALDALKNGVDGQTSIEMDEAVTALREALAKSRSDVGQPAQQQEPVAYAVYHRMGGSKSLHWTEQHSDDGDHNQYQLVPLYTSPPAQRTWVNATTWRGLTQQDIDIAFDDTQEGGGFNEFARAIESKLKEKNT